MPDNFLELITRAESLIDIERQAEAIPLLTKALAIDPESSQANGLMALSYLGLERYEEALKFADSAIQSDPEDEWGHRIRSLCLTEMGRHREALKSAEEAVRLEPDDPNTLSTLANALLSVKKAKKAKEIGEKLLEAAPYWDGAHFTMGNIQLATGDNYLAERSFREALKINPSFANARNNLGVAILRQKTDKPGSMFGFSSNSIIVPPDAGSTEQHFQEALKLEPGNEHAAENFRNQYSYVIAIVPIFAFIPFMIMAFLVIPIGTLISLGITAFWSARAFNHVRTKRASLSPEMLEFVKTKSFFGEDGVLRIIGSTLWHCMIRTWKPHLLAVASLLIFGSSLAFRAPGLRSLSSLLMIGASWWLAYESRKDD